MKNREFPSQPAFMQIKSYLLAQIQSGYWREGDAIPSEAMLAEQFSVSRMTVNRAVRELTSEQFLQRVQGSGTYVAQQKYQATLVAIRSIAEEVRARGHLHSSVLHELKKIKADELLAHEFECKIGAMLFHSLIVHYEDGQPIQVEDRWVNAKLVPDYLQQDFRVMTPNEYLMNAAPLQGVDYRIEAVLPSKAIATMLAIQVKDACLVLHRKTRSQDQVASVVTMWHPGQRYQFLGSF